MGVPVVYRVRLLCTSCNLARRIGSVRIGYYSVVVDLDYQTTVVEPDASHKKLLQHLMGYCFSPDVVQQKLHL